MDVLGGVKLVWELGKDLAGRVRGLPRAPRRTLVVLPEHESRLWWSKAAVSGNPAMMVVGDFHFTNLHTAPTSLPKSFLVVRPHRWRRSLRVEGDISVQSQQSNLHGRFEIPPQRTTTGRASWFIRPP